MIGLKLKEFRLSFNLSQRDIAQLLNITQAYYWKWESGRSIPDAKQMLMLCKIFKCTPNDLYGINDIHDTALLNWDDNE